ncbi:MAG TPA: hypothetical protein VKV28_11630 [Candidatus Binataceae bacterium]|nr:hypothetical protein [Candidatus Binataceae bacterium]
MQLSWRSILFCGFLASMLAWADSAFAQVGNRNFIDPIITQDPNPSNELDITPMAYADAQLHAFSLEADMEKQFSANLSIDAAFNYVYPTCDNPHTTGCTPTPIGRRSHRKITRTRKRSETKKKAAIGNPQELAAGFGNPEFLGKWAFYASDRHELRLAIGVDAIIAAGNYEAGANTHNYVGPVLMLAKGMGDLPDRGWLRFLRPFALQADGGTLTKTSGATANIVYSDADLSYQLSYLHDFVRGMAGVPQWLSALTPFAEFSYAGEFNGSVGVAPQFTLLPGIAYSQGAFQYSFASMFALNQASVPFNHVIFMGLIDIALDELYPIFGRTLF